MGHAFIAKSHRAWLDQARQASDTLAAKAPVTPPGAEPLPLRQLADVDRDAFGQLVEAMVALGVTVSDELIDLAGLRPVEEVLELP